MRTDRNKYQVLLNYIELYEVLYNRTKLYRTICIRQSLKIATSLCELGRCERCLSFISVEGQYMDGLIEK